jgi:hypothetical protein
VIATELEPGCTDFSRWEAAAAKAGTPEAAHMAKLNAGARYVERSGYVSD